jgi:hypothetical protein
MKKGYSAFQTNFFKDLIRGQTRGQIPLASDLGSGCEGIGHVTRTPKVLTLIHRNSRHSDSAILNLFFYHSRIAPAWREQACRPSSASAR